MKTVLVTCPCGTEFRVAEERLAKGRGRYCGNRCKYRFRVRPSGLKYVIHSENPTSFKMGHTRHPKGASSWLWKGDQASYQELHRWVRREKGPRPEACERCGAKGYTEWANLSHQYRRDLTDWAALCRLCHRRHDSGDARGSATARYGSRALQGLGS